MKSTITGSSLKSPPGPRGTGLREESQTDRTQVSEWGWEVARAASDRQVVPGVPLTPPNLGRPPASPMPGRGGMEPNTSRPPEGRERRAQGQSRGNLEFESHHAQGFGEHR